MAHHSRDMVFLLLMSMVCLSRAAITDQLCDPGWTFGGGYCYYYSQATDTLPRSEAIQECVMMDAELAWPESKGELDWLSNEAARFGQAYGWRLNMVKKGGRDLVVFDMTSNKFESIPKDGKNVPQLDPTDDTNGDVENTCIAFDMIRPRYNAARQSIWYETAACSVLLRTACTGAKSDFKDQFIDGNKWFSNGNTIFWVSADLLTFDSANDQCKSKEMTIVGDPASLSVALGNWTFDGTPFWSSIKLGKDGPQWNNGSAVTTKTFTWNPPSLYYVDYILLSSGKVRAKPFFSLEKTDGLPYICKKRAITKQQFGCPNLWRRAGRSCYFIGKHIRLPWEKAKKTCNDLDSHLLTINSRTEITWLRIYFQNTYLYAWTSANDIASEGNFVWHDGSKMDNTIFPWNNGFHASLYLRCVAVMINTGSFKEVSCKGRFSPACQYTLMDGETQCASGWQKFQTTCYFLEEDPKLFVTYSQNTRSCLSRTSGVAVHRVNALEIPTDDVMNFLQSKKYSFLFWLGLEATTFPGQYHWSDGTVYHGDRFISKKQPDNGGDHGPQNCVTVNRQGNAKDENCNDSRWYICEKELQDNGGASDFEMAFIVLLLPSILVVWTLDCFV